MLHLNDYLNGTTAEFKQVPSSTNGDGHDHDSAQGHVHNGGNNHRRRVRHQIQHGRRWSAVKADNAIMMVEVCGLQVADATERCGTNSNAYYAQKALRKSGNTALCNSVMKGNDPLLAAGRRVRNAAVAVTAIKKCSALERELIRVATGMTSDPVTVLLNLTPEQLVTAARELGSGWLWEMMVVPAMTNEPATEPVNE